MVKQSTFKEYARGNIPTVGNPTYNEAWALIEVSRRIAAIIRYGDLTKIEDKKRLREVLRLNLRIWTIIQAEQLTGENQLPDPIRLNILTLCKFIDNQTIDTMLNPTAEKAATLININRNIAAGLMGSVSDDDLPSPSEAPEDEQPSEPGTPDKGVGIKV